MKNSRAAFTLTEMLIASAISVVLGGIIYTMGSEALFSFSRNVSLNRGYSEARSSMDRIGELVQSAGHTPVLLNEDGSLWSTSTPTTPMTATRAAGMRFYCYGTQPSYDITTCTATGNSMAVAVPAGTAAPKIGDVVAINAVGFQGIVASTTGTSTVTMTFTNMSGVAASSIASLCSANLTTTPDLSSYYCLVYNRVAFIAVSTPALSSPSVTPAAANAATSTELRYYPDANVMTKYKVLAHLVLNQTDAQEQYILRPRPFQIASPPTVTVTLCEQAPDYTNRTITISDATTFTRVQSSFGSRSPLLLTGPW